MQMIDDLIDALSASGCSMEDALIKAQVLAARLGDSEMSSWVKAELTGYPSGSNVPPYRLQTLTLTGTIGNGLQFYRNQALPTAHLSDREREYLTHQSVRPGVGAIDHLARQEDKGERFAVPVAPEFYGILSKQCSAGFRVTEAWGHPPAGGTRQIITQIRSRLLEFVLALRDRVPAEAKPSELRDVVPLDVSRSLFDNTIGSNITVVVNSGTMGNVAPSINHNDLSALKTFLHEQGIDASKIDQLEEAIKEDHGSLEHAKKRLGHAVAQWLGDVTKTAIKVSTETAVKLALRSYYGF